MRPVRFKTTFYIAFSSALMVPYLMLLIAAILAVLLY